MIQTLMVFVLNRERPHPSIRLRIGVKEEFDMNLTLIKTRVSGMVPSLELISLINCVSSTNNSFL